MDDTWCPQMKTLALQKAVVAPTLAQRRVPLRLVGGTWVAGHRSQRRDCSSTGHRCDGFRTARWEVHGSLNIRSSLSSGRPVTTLIWMFLNDIGILNKHIYIYIYNIYIHTHTRNPTWNCMLFLRSQSLYQPSIIHHYPSKKIHLKNPPKSDHALLFTSGSRRPWARAP